MAKITIKIVPEILNWIIQEIQFENISDSVFQTLYEWQSGEKIPTFSQIEDISRKTNIPFGYFFLKTPPKEKCSIVEYRTIDSLMLRNPSRNLIDTLDMMTNIQEWMREYLKDNGYGQLEFVGRYQNQKEVKDIVKDIRGTLKLNDNWFINIKNPADSFKYLRTLYENIGILVMMNGTVGQNTHRKLDVSEFRAFTLVDSYAPLIFINTCDSNSGKLFSLLHELVHIWLGVNSFFNEQEVSITSVKPLEQTCNIVVAEILVPNEIFVQKWNEKNIADIEKITDLAGYFKCSKSVITRKALDNRYITKERYEIIMEEISRQYNEWQESQSKKKSSGGDFYKTMRSKMDRRFINALENSAREGRTQYAEAYRLTKTNRKTFSKLVNEMGGAEW